MPVSLTPALLRIPARSLLVYTTPELFDRLEGDFILVFDDEEIVTHEKEACYSSFAWEYHRRYPETPLLLKHHVKTVIKNKRLGVKTHLELINNVLWTTYDTYKHQVPNRTALIDALTKLSYEITNTIYNDLSYRLEEYVTTLDILDFTRITSHPKIKEAYRVMESSEAGISKINAEINALIADVNELPGNSLTKTLRSGLARQNQALQCLGPRGFLTDIDSGLFRTPVKRGFVQGIRNLYEAMVESRTASISLIYSTEPLQQSEYFSRRQQLICQNVKTLHLGDCGSTHYLPWHVRDVRYHGETKVGDCDLKTIAGKYYLEEETQTLKIVNESDRHLIGKTLKLRSVIAGCCHPDPSGICEICFGQLSEAVPANSNIGHITCVTMTSDLGQMILSTKHFIGSSVIEGIVLTGEEKKYLDAPINGNTYMLNERLRGKTVHLMIPAAKAMGLADLNVVDEVSKLSITRVSEFDKIWLFVADKRGEEKVPLAVSVQGRLSSMTHELLAHIKERGWSVTKENNYVIDMEGWDYTKPMLLLPMRHASMAQHQQEIANLLESTVGESESRSTLESPCAMIVELHDLVNRRLAINLAILEVILYGSMIVSAKDNDYSLPKPWTLNGIGTMREIFKHRSLGPAMGFQNHLNTFVAPSSYCFTNRLDHVLDVCVLPAEVLGYKV